MRRPVPNGADARPRFYIRQTVDGAFAWRRGIGGADSKARSPGAALDALLASVGFGPTVVIWEGRHDVD